MPRPASPSSPSPEAPPGSSASRGPEALVATRSEEETVAFGVRLSALLQAGDVLALRGDLGAGKTTLVRGLARGLGSPDRVSSPTFVLMNVYEGRLPLFHFDAYRLDGPGDLEAIGAEDYLEGEGVAVVEWSERVEALLPADRLEITLERGAGADERQIRIRARGSRAAALLEALA